MAWRNRSGVFALTAMAFALAASPALAQKHYGPGVTDTEIKIGTTTPYSGPASAYSAGAISATAYFTMINEQGGVNGRKINFISLDDAYSPPKTVEQIRRLIESDEVSFLVNPVGTATNMAVFKYINQRGAASLHRHRRHGFQRPRALSVDDGLDAALCVGRRIYAATFYRKPDAKIGIPGAERRPRRDYLIGFRRGKATRRRRVVSTRAYSTADPTGDSQVVSLKLPARTSSSSRSPNFPPKRFARPMTSTGTRRNSWSA